MRHWSALRMSFFCESGWRRRLGPTKKASSSSSPQSSAGRWPAEPMVALDAFPAAWPGPSSWPRSGPRSPRCQSRPVLPLPLLRLPRTRTPSKRSADVERPRSRRASRVVSCASSNSLPRDPRGTMGPSTCRSGLPWPHSGQRRGRMQRCRPPSRFSRRSADATRAAPPLQARCAGSDSKSTKPSPSCGPGHGPGPQLPSLSRHSRPIARVRLWNPTLSKLSRPSCACPSMLQPLGQSAAAPG
mmetsp:Transcript_8264/g.23481  ORF Transcript_8264/g.23481 Transcript_8264/m.23481 type:complete len:243 (+) Transcript_8264:803-1531(+)